MAFEAGVFAGTDEFVLGSWSGGDRDSDDLIGFNVELVDEFVSVGGVVGAKVIGVGNGPSVDPFEEDIVRTLLHPLGTGDFEAKDVSLDDGFV